MRELLVRLEKRGPRESGGLLEARVNREGVFVLEVVAIGLLMVVGRVWIVLEPS